jgi:hypothetical protein
LLEPDGGGTSIGAFLEFTALDIEGLSVEIDLDADPEDNYAHGIADRLAAFGDDLLYVDTAWCQAVEGTIEPCQGNDETVPILSQDLGRGDVVRISGGPVHTREAQNGASLLGTVFDDLSIARR